MNMLKRVLNHIRYFRELPMGQLDDRPASAAFAGQTIPPYVYQTWESVFFGKTHLKEIEKFRDRNPDLSFILFDKHLRDKYMKDFWGTREIYAIYQRTQFGPMKADIFRYCILFERGGFYFDISKGCRAPIRSLCASESLALISFESNDSIIPPDLAVAQQLEHPDKLVLQWGMGFAPQHPILGRMIENICLHYPYFRGRIYPSPKSAILRLTGPGMFTKSVRDAFKNEGLLNVAQAGIDFNGNGIFALKGSRVRYLTAASYTKAKDCPIVL